MSPILTINEATTICRLSRATLYRIIGRGEEHPFIQVEGRWLVYEDELHDWIRSHRKTPRPDSMPKPRRRGSADSFLAKVQRERRAA